MTCFIINIEESEPDGDVRATIQRFDGENVTAYDLGLIAVFKHGDITGTRFYDGTGDQIT